MRIRVAILVLLIPLMAYAQQEGKPTPDKVLRPSTGRSIERSSSPIKGREVSVPDSMTIRTDSTIQMSDTTDYKYYIDLTKRPDAIKAVWLGAVVPGAGQIYNRSYWKLPIVYGAFMGCGYAISMMQNRYQGYKNAYLELYSDIQAGTVTEDPSKIYIMVLPNGYTLSQVGGASTWVNTLKNRQSIYRRYRDYSILATVVVYALSLIDAYVDAQLFDYDISPDLTLNVSPEIYYDVQQQRSAEIKVAIQF